MLSITSRLRAQAEKRPVLWLLLGTLLMAPILMPLGALFLAAVLWSMVGWPLFAGIQIYEGHYLFGFALGFGWLLLIRFGGRFLRWSLQGLESGAL
jgi:prepilin signal peptidase PulO-like enzyme (type II secretory pathway)